MILVRGNYQNRQKTGDFVKKSDKIGDYEGQKLAKQIQFFTW